MAAKGKVEIHSDECKGCGLCVESCPPKKLHLDEELNHYGVHPAVYDGEGCSGCGICFYCCPEPGAITVYKEVSTRPSEKAPEGRATQAPEGRATQISTKPAEVDHAPSL